MFVSNKYKIGPLLLDMGLYKDAHKRGYYVSCCSPVLFRLSDSLWSEMLDDDVVVKSLHDGFLSQSIQHDCTLYAKSGE